ncbi:hypothetical protein CSIM01_05603 [Colletotrichum simmondsii]|uniref:Carbohydrate kinase PfkB domain-containing protein n=1 Tax=Colletotrichum simmondsii TaxID=703756 RepID=A0A135SRB9_9PEZI|nr:hypothetical protein CSIM01_05603 [Colletotrichum simmondsii]
MIVPRFPKTGESIKASHSEKALGGKGANTALSTYRSCHYEESLGRGDGAIRVKMIGKAGDDTHGGTLIAKLLENDIDISGVEVAPYSPSNERVVMIDEETHESRAAILLDYTEGEVKVDCPKATKRFLNLGVKNVVITLGAKGAYYANAKVSGLCAGYAVPVLDTTGAGLTQVESDTFTGAYAADYVRQISSPSGEWDIESAVVRANQAAAISIGSAGAQGHIPWANEIDLFDMMAEMTLD